MTEYQVTCITKPNRYSAHEHITHIGGYQWYITREEAIQKIESKTHAFYTVNGVTGDRIYIGVVREAGESPYLRTYANGKWNDNLLSLPECGV